MKVALGVALVGSALLAGCRPGGQGEPSPPGGRQVFRLRPAEVSGSPGGPRREAEARLPVEPPESEVVAVRSGLAEGERVLLEVARPRSDGAARVVLPAAQVASRPSTVAAAGREVPYTVTVGGRLAFDDRRVTHVFSPLGGRIAEILAAPGEHVRKGAPLAVLISPDLGSAFSDELKAKADQVAAERQRQEEMHELKASSDHDLEAAEDLDRARAEYDRAEDGTRLLREGAQGAASQRFLPRSPIAGDVIARLANPGLEAQGPYSGAGNTLELLAVGKIDPLSLLGDVCEDDLPCLKLGAELTLRVAAHPGGTFRGRVHGIADAPDPVLRTVEARCVLGNAEGLLRPEMYGAAGIAAPLRRAVAVPPEAFVRLGDETVVVVEGPSQGEGVAPFERRRVVVNEQLAGDHVPVLQGLGEGERVATRGAIFLLGM